MLDWYGVIMQGMKRGPRRSETEQALECKFSIHRENEGLLVADREPWPGVGFNSRAVSQC